MSSNKISNIPHFIKARSPEGLRRLMLRNNVKWGLIFNYYQIIFDGNTWFAWFQLDAVDALEDEIKQMEARGKGDKVDG